MGSHLFTPTGQPLSKDGSVHITDEFYNALLSSVGAILSVIGSYFLIAPAVAAGQTLHIIGFSIYSFGTVLVFATSALHHGVNSSPRVEALLRHVDYLAIFVKIPATLTPFCLILIPNRFGFFLLSLVWGISLFGLILKLSRPQISKNITLLFYVGLGILGGTIIFPALQELTLLTVLLILLGGFFYLCGAVIYYKEKPNPFPGRFGFHEIWHLFVVFGSATFFGVIFFYLLPHP
ncbi:MAG: hemolysin III family protein [Deltaproteobacteria bacterium]|nr:hemolysin III family protein [Deltaproteobacteria bacterium]